jgi:Tol biopolymer transport system component
VAHRLVILSALAITLGVPPVASAQNAAAPGGIVFTWANPVFNSEEVGLIQADGSHQTKLTSERGFDVAAAWSPDGRRIVFTSARSMPPGFQGSQLPYSELWVMNADGSNVQRITSNVGLVDFEAAWSPDGRRIVVPRGPSTPPPPGYLTQPTDLWIIDLVSGREQQLTNSPSTWEGWPHWSPDGRRIAFEGDLVEPGNDDVYTINVDGSGLERLTTRPGFDGDVRYSPDGTSLVFDSDRTGNLDLFVMRTNGTNVRQLTDDPSFEGSGSFSPDGRFIAFTKDVDGVPDIFRMRADGTQPTNLTRSPLIFEFDSEWQP